MQNTHGTDRSARPNIPHGARAPTEFQALLQRSDAYALWPHLDMTQRQQVKAYALQEYQAKADKNVLELFFDTWQALWAKLFDA